MMHAIKASLKDTMRRANRALNPLYRNPVVVTPDSLHLNSPLALPNCDIAHHQILELIKDSQPVVDAIADMDGEYVLKAAIDADSHMLRVNAYHVYQLEDLSEELDGADLPLFNRAELVEGIFTYTVVADRANRKAVIRKLAANMGGLTYPRWDPVSSWEIELLRDQLTQLGLTHFH